MAPKNQQKPAATAVSTDLQFPPKPPRLGKAPGRDVELITNLFRISLKTEKPIQCYTIQVDLLAGKDERASKSGDGGQKKPAVPRKIPKDLRQQAVRTAVRKWVDNNAAAGKKAPCYVLDGNGSTMYALFQMLDQHDGSSGTRKNLEIQVSVASPCIIDKKSVSREEVMLVKFYSPTQVNVRALMDHCVGKRPRNSVEVEATLKALNTILTGRILIEPGFLGMQAKTGSCSVFDFKKQNQFSISEGVFCNRGFISSVRHTETGLVANVANSVVPFYEPLMLTDMLKRRFRVQDFSRGVNPKILDELRRELRTKQVEALHINYGTPAKPHYRKYRIHDIGMSTIKETFDFDDPKIGKTIKLSVFDYFKREYPKCPLKFPELPCIIDNKRKIPLEICRLVDQQKVNRRLTPNETREVIKQAALKPEVHFDKVRQNAETLCKFDQSFRDFGLEIERKLIELTGRELPPVKLWGAQKASMSTQNGEYDNLRSRFVRPASILKWAIIILGDDRFQQNFRSQPELISECKRFANDYCKAGNMKGVTISSLADNAIRYVQVKMNDQDQAIKKRLRDEFVGLNTNNFGHALFVLPGIKDWIYSYLQFLEVDVPKQMKKTSFCTRASCVKDDNFVKKILRPMNPRNASMFISNLWLKHNTKLGGINYVLDETQGFSINPKEFNNFLAPGYLFVSIDVCHPAPGDRLEQSVAAAVGMWDITSPQMSTCTRVRVQRKDKSDKEKSTVEQVGEIGVMFGEIMESYRKKKKVLPKHIVVLRDGVSEGQFQMVLRFELAQIGSVIKNMQNKYNGPTPLLACLTVQKRHRTRFMRKKPVETRRGPDYNIQPGTVVDHSVVEPLHHSFYLAPHKAIQGTAKAPHVFMIYDEIKFSQDSAQAMIFALSYLSPRCTKGTSIPTPINLADLAAERGKNIVVSWNEDNAQKMSTDERLAKLNAFLSTMGDSTYHETLYYV